MCGPMFSTPFMPFIYLYLVLYMLHVSAKLLLVFPFFFRFFGSPKNHSSATCQIESAAGPQQRCSILHKRPSFINEFRIASNVYRISYEVYSLSLRRPSSDSQAFGLQLFALRAGVKPSAASANLYRVLPARQSMAELRS